MKCFVCDAPIASGKYCKSCADVVGFAEVLECAHLAVRRIHPDASLEDARALIHLQAGEKTDPNSQGKPYRQTTDLELREFLLREQCRANA